MMKRRIIALVVLLVGAGIGYFVYWSQLNEWKPFKLGLDLSGGTHLVYDADTSKIEGDVAEALTALQNVIERRVNAFGVGEPLVQTEQAGALGRGTYRLIVELPGVTDVDEAIKMIGQTPLLEFKLVTPGLEGGMYNADGTLKQDAFVDTGLTGKYLKNAQLQFGNGTGVSNEAVVVVNFNSEGAQLFSDITNANVGNELAIFLDGSLLSAPVIRDKIDNGTAVISGNFTPEGAKEMVRNLNLGALPVPIELASTQTIGATLGDEAVRSGVAASLIGFAALCVFMVVWYRLPGIIASVALVMYTVVMLALFQLIPVVLTAAGIAAFILSIGLAVDANILIAERMKEEMAAGKKMEDAVREGFSRAWLAIRDTNIAHIIASIILFWLGTSIIKGFALVFGVGVIVSMLSAIVISRSFLRVFALSSESRVMRFLMSSGLR